MILFLLLLLVIVSYRCKFCGATFYKDYLSREQTLCINGIFMAYILFSHTFNVCSSQNFLNNSFGVIQVYLGQFPVVPILFFSGYGIMEFVFYLIAFVATFILIIVADRIFKPLDKLFSKKTISI